ncbi:MAG: tetratricopeptide repeat protein [Treponema sp.]|jgi:tetratricopeptide (TPR) repeat protein|nr:tetratricopeptide repeat protein [Treponema sp.]
MHTVFHHNTQMDDSALAGRAVYPRVPLKIAVFLAFVPLLLVPGRASSLEQPASPSGAGEAAEAAPQTARDYLDRGQAFAETRDYERAIAEYDKAIALDPAYQAAYLKRGDANTNLWNYDQAIADYSRAVELDGQHKDAYLKRGGAYQADNQAQLAWDDYLMTIQLDPQFVDGYSALGFLLNAAGNHQGAVEVFSQAINLDPLNPGLLMGRIMANMNLADADGVLADCRIIHEQVPGQNIMVYVYEAQVYLRLGEFDKAVEILKQGIGHVPAGALKTFPLITAALKAQGYGESGAIAEVQRIIEELPSANPGQADFKDYLLAVAGAEDPGLDFDRSIAEQRRKIITLNKRGVMPYFSLLVYYLGKEDIDGAIDEMNAAVERNPEDSGPYAIRAFAAFLKAVSELMEEPRERQITLFRNKSGAVIADCDMALSLDANLAGVYQVRGLVKKLSELAGAEEDLSAAIRLKPDEKENWYARGWSYFEGKNYSAARKDFIQALNIDSSFREALYGFARSCAALGDHRQAVDFYTAYIRGNAGDREALYYRGESLKALGETEAAENDFAAARELDTEGQEIRESLDLRIGFNVSF